MKKCYITWTPLHQVDTPLRSICTKKAVKKYCRYLQNNLTVERLTEYQQAARMPALQHFNPTLKREMKLAQVFHQTQNILFYVSGKKHFLYGMF
jgi:hypothetical protein